MPRYFFHLHDGIDRRDPEGSELPDLDAARCEAVCLAGCLMRDNVHEMLKGKDWHLDVEDERGLILFQVEVCLTDAPAARPDPLMVRKN